MQIKKDPNNVRKHGKKNKELINKSLNDFGAGRSILIDQEDVLIAGEGVFEQATSLGIPIRIVESDGSELIAIKRTDLQTDDEKRKLLALADNQTNETSEFDLDLLKDNFDLDILNDWGFDDFDLGLITEEVHLEEDNYNTVLPIEPVTQYGDIYELGDHRLICGDSALMEDVAKLMEGEKGQLIFTDPPYNVNYRSQAGLSYDSAKYGGSGGKIFNDNKSDKDCIAFYSNVLKTLYEHTEDSTPLYWWYALNNYALNEAAFKNSGWHISQTIIWLKESMIFSYGQDYHRCYEPCLFGWKKKKKHYKAKDINNYKDVFALSQEDYRDAMDLWFEKRDNTNEYVHPTQKPIRLAERALRKHSKPNYLVMDMFGGSGSTLIGCEQSGRRARVSEMDPKYCDVIAKRYVKYSVDKGNDFTIHKNGKDIKSEEWLYAY